jgi:hypothetical protein
MRFLTQGNNNSEVRCIQMNNHESFNIRLQQLKSEEANLEKYLQENGNSLDSSEVSNINNSLIALRLEKNEIEQIVSGAFY